MRKTWWISLTILESALAFGFGLAGPSKAQEGHDHAAATRGGAQAQTKRYHFEATFSTTGLKLTVHSLGSQVRRRVGLERQSDLLPSQHDETLVHVASCVLPQQARARYRPPWSLS